MMADMAYSVWLFVSSLAGKFTSFIPLLGPSTVAPGDEELLSLDLEDDDYLYRIRRGSRVVYVSVLDGEIVPRNCRTDGYRVLSKLRSVPKWDDATWKTLTVRRKDSTGAIESTSDEFLPHGLDLGQLRLALNADFFNLVDLKTVSRIGYRLSRVAVPRDGDDGMTTTWMLKLAQFKHEVPALQREISIYSTLASSGFPLSPKFMGFVYEETKSRTVGFLMEEISGRIPDIQDLDACTTTIRQLHTHGIIHKDPNKYNFLVTESGAKVFDFESSVTRDELEDFSAAAEEELESLAAKLEDESGIGQY